MHGIKLVEFLIFLLQKFVAILNQFGLRGFIN